MAVSDPAPRLNEYDQDEWWNVARRLRPWLAREEFDQQWAEFQRLKQWRANDA